MPKMKRELVKEAIAELRRVYEDGLSFNYEEWGAIQAGRTRHTCKTVACAGGYLALHKPFQKLGLGFYKTTDLVPMFTDPATLKEYSGTGALCMFFGLGQGVASEVFVDLGSVIDKDKVTALDVADRLQYYLDLEQAHG